MLTGAPPSPELFFETVNAHVRTAALRAAIELDVFTAIGDAPATAAEIAERCKASLRGTRMLCDYLTILGFLCKSGEAYTLTPDSAVFLDRRSPAYLGGTIQFLGSPAIVRNFDTLTDTIRRGSVPPPQSTVSPENAVWVEFARAMRPMMAPAAEAIAQALAIDSHARLKVLDIAAGHGAFGIAVASRNPRAELYAVDWAAVLEVARENAAAAGVGDRFHAIPGDAFSVEYGTGYDLALVTNFLHHFDEETCTGLLRKVSAALAPGGRVAVLEFVPNEDRISPPIPAGFVMMMLSGTPLGDAYPLSALRRMLEAAGFGDVTAQPLPTPQTVVFATTR